MEVLVTRTQLSKELGISPKWVDESRLKGRLPEYEPGTKLFDRDKALKCWESWQEKVNEEDPDSFEYLESSIRLCRSRSEIAHQKLMKLKLSLIPAAAVKEVYQAHRSSVDDALRAFVDRTTPLIIGMDAIPAVHRALNEQILACLDALYKSPSTTKEKYREPIERTIEPDLKKRILQEKKILNNVEAELRETKAEVISGELLNLAAVEQVILERVSIARSKMLALPHEAARLLVARDVDYIHQQLTDKAAQVAEALPEWSAADFMDDDAVDDVLADVPEDTC